MSDYKDNFKSKVFERTPSKQKEPSVNTKESYVLEENSSSSSKYTNVVIHKYSKHNDSNTQMF